MAEADVVTVNELFSVVWNTITDYKPFLLLINVDNTFMKRAFNSRHNEGEALIECLEYYCNNVCLNLTKVQIWEDVASAIQECGNARRAQEIREKLGQSSEEYAGFEEDYCGYYSSLQAQRKAEAAAEYNSEGSTEWLKSTTTLDYSEASRKITELCIDVTEVLNNEERDASEILLQYKSKGEKQGNECEISLNELAERSSRLEEILNNVMKKLQSGDCTAFPLIKKVNDEYAEIEKSVPKAKLEVEKYRKLVSNETGDSVAKTEDVIHSLQAIMKLSAVKTEVNTADELPDEDQYDVVKTV